MIPRCALEYGSDLRIDRIMDLIRSCPYSIHDLSMQSLDTTSGLPRFNMVFELGLVIGCINSGVEHASKKFLVFDSKPHRLDISCSDLKGYDGRIHSGKAYEIILSTGEWLANLDGRREQYLPENLIEEFEEFEQRLPEMCNHLKRKVNEVSYPDLCWLMSVFLDEKDAPLSRGA
jgi:hypothetical protein